MKILPVVLSLLMLGASVSPQAAASWDGFVTDTHCGTHCQRTSTMSPDRACVRRCVKAGSKYGLWYQDHVYVLEPQVKAAKFAAENVRVVGTLAGDTIQIQSISPIAGKPPNAGQ